MTGRQFFHPKHSIVFTSTESLEAEPRLLECAALPDGLLTENKLAALTIIADSWHVLDVLVGPAGADKTTAMNAPEH